MRRHLGICCAVALASAVVTRCLIWVNGWDITPAPPRVVSTCANGQACDVMIDGNTAVGPAIDSDEVAWTNPVRLTIRVEDSP